MRCNMHYRAAMRSLGALAIIFLASTSMVAAPDPHEAIMARAVALDISDPAQTRVGALRYLGGWVLTSRHPAFGGISAIDVRAGHFLALSDAGVGMRFRFDGKTISDPVFQALPAGPGTGAEKIDRDSESMVVDHEGGHIWAGFERWNTIWRYSADLSRAEAHAEPPAMADWPWNDGPESMVRLRDGRFIVIAETATGPDGSTTALLFPGDPTTPGAKPLRFFYRAPEGFKPTDAAQLPDGRLIVLNRRYTPLTGVAAALTIINPGSITADVVLEGAVVARLRPPQIVDNMEALSVEQEAGRTILWIASDDNFNPLQRTILLKFALEPAPAP